MFNSTKYLLLSLLITSSIWTISAESSEEHDDESLNAIDEQNVKVTENRLAAQLSAVIEHFKQPDPVGMPGADIPDPMDVPPIKKNLGMAALTMQNVKAHGLSKFRISNIQADLKAMKVHAGIVLDEMLVKGIYTLSSFFSKANGDFTVLLKKVHVKCVATLAVERTGKLTTDQIKMDITFGDMTMDFQNLGFLGSVFQSIINTAPNLVFDAMKPFMLAESDKKLREGINTNIATLMGDRRLPNSITPLDMAIAEARKKVRAMGYDPYHLPDYNRTIGIMNIQLANIWIIGISSFYRVGDMIAEMENNTVSLQFEVGTQSITGAGQWEASLSLVSHVGHIQFSVEHISVTVGISQPLDTQKRPQINHLDIDIGNIQIRCDGAGTLDYTLEFMLNILPNLLRYQIMDALENPIKMRIQEKFNTIDVEKAIKDNFEKFQTTGESFSFDFKI